MNLNPLKLARSAAQDVLGAAKGAGGWVQRTIGGLPADILDLSEGWQAPGSDASDSTAPPSVGPLVANPRVRPTGRPVSIGSSGAPLLAKAHNLSARTPAVAVAIVVPSAGDRTLTVRAAGPGTSWGTKGRESAAMAVFVDGKYNQEIILHRGATLADYSVSLGLLSAGPHVVSFAYDPKGSSPGARGVDLGSATVDPVATGQQALLERYQPFFYGRGTTENNYDDTPLAMWATVSHSGQDTVLHYNVIHSNENGGTGADPTLEEATWGRNTDPDPICTVTVGPDGKIKGVNFEGHGDRWFEFSGKFNGNHPLLRVSTLNNDYSDHGTSPFLFRPKVQAESPDFFRENLMNENPWMYQVSNQEVAREGKVMSQADAAKVMASEGSWGFQAPSKLFDARDYLYVDVKLAPSHDPVHVEVKLKGSNQWYRSNLGDQALDIGGAGLPTSVPKWIRESFLATWIDKGIQALGFNFGGRSGWIRTTVGLPPGARPSAIEAVRVVDDGGGKADVQGFGNTFMLSDQYQPEYLKLSGPGGAVMPGHPVVARPASVPGTFDPTK